MDNEKDLYIKQKLKEDKLMSKKAEDVFNNFFGGIENMEEEEKIVDINEAKDKKFQRKRILGIVATLMVVFLGANVYAATQGYGNIFFMIKNISSTGTITGKDEILKDQDITISYEPIEIAKGISVQFNRFIVKDNKAKLTMRVDQNGGMASDKKISQVEVMSGDIDTELATVSLRNEDDTSYTKDIEIGFFNNDMKLLKININSSKEKMAELEIDLLNRQITVISNSYNEIEKISEIELKEALGNYAILNFYNDTTDNVEDIYGKNATKEQCINYELVNCAIGRISDKEVRESNGNVETIYYTVEKVNKAIKEMTGIEVKDHIDMKDGFCYYNKNLKQYEFEAGDGSLTGLCLNITDISFEDGIYTVDYQYCYPDDSSYWENTMDKLPAYESTLQFKLNDNYEYAKYCIVSNIYELKSRKIKNAQFDENTNTVTTNNTVTTENTNNTVYINNTVSVDNTTYIPSVNETWGNKYELIDNVSWEYRYSEKIRNYKDFNYDLDGDGWIDKITIRKDKSDESGMNYFFELNGVTFAENSFGSRIYIADLDVSDNTVEVVIFDEGPSDDLEYTIYSKIGDRMQEIITIQGGDLVLNSQGNLRVKSILTLSEIYPDIYYKEYMFKNNSIVSENICDINTDIEYRAYGMVYITKDLSAIEKVMSSDWDDFEEAIKKAGIKKIDDRVTFKIKSFIDETKAIIEYNGEEYYLFSHQGNFAD